MDKLTRREKEKLARKEAIIEAAEKLFYENGFDRVSMDQVAKEAEFTKRTLYQYFPGKEELYFAVALRGFRRLFTYCGEAMARGKNGNEKLRLSGTAYYRFFKDNPETFRVINSIGAVKKRSGGEYDQWRNFDKQMFRSFTDIIEEGKADGSIRKDLDAEKCTYSIIFMTTAFFNFLAQTGESFTKHAGIDMDEFVNYTLELYGGVYKRE